MVEKIKTLNRIILIIRALYGFNMTSEITKGEITLLVNVGGLIKETKFYVIDGVMRYNALKTFERKVSGQH